LGIVLRKTQLAENYYSGGMPLSEVMCILGKKQYPRMFLGTILLKDYHQETKIFVSCIGFQPVDTL
jgi:hypothetical protein